MQKSTCMAASRAPRNAASTVGLYGTVSTLANLLGKADICLPGMSSVIDEHVLTFQIELIALYKPQHMRFTYDLMQKLEEKLQVNGVTSPDHASCILHRKALAVLGNAPKVIADMTAKATRPVSSASPMACTLCRAHLISVPRGARRSPQRRPFSIRHFDSRIYAKRNTAGEMLSSADRKSKQPVNLTAKHILAGSGGFFDTQKPVITDDDLIPSDAEVVPLEGIYQSGS